MALQHGITSAEAVRRPRALLAGTLAGIARPTRAERCGRVCAGSTPDTVPFDEHQGVLRTVLPVSPSPKQMEDAMPEIDG